MSSSSSLTFGGLERVIQVPPPSLCLASTVRSTNFWKPCEGRRGPPWCPRATRRKRRGAVTSPLGSWGSRTGWWSRWGAVTLRALSTCSRRSRRGPQRQESVHASRDPWAFLSGRHEGEYVLFFDRIRFTEIIISSSMSIHCPSTLLLNAPATCPHSAWVSH